ncbi:MAG: DnaJ domain-containing protein [Phycisphaeraceae bacterium]|nr:DnaJ domain-containing protein [Phycisphaeraceae bacterium]
MAVKYQDYYQILDVGRSASAEEIHRAYRKKARQYHPDVNKEADAAGKFNKVNEAYEVLKDPEKRKRYDQLGENWKAGQEFRPPPGWENVQFRFNGHRPGQAGGSFSFGGGDFSDFFDMLFGHGPGGAGGPGGGASGGVSGGGSTMEELFASMGGGGAGRGRSGRSSRTHAAPAVEAELEVSLEEIYHGGTRQVRLQLPSGQIRTLDVKIPRGVSEGSVIRLKGEGGTSGGGENSGGDLLLKVKIAPHARFEVSGKDLTTDLALSPWEAALGTRAAVRTLDQEVTLTIPPGTSSGQRLRLRGKGLPGLKEEEAGDLFVRVQIVVPKTLTDEERKLFEKLKETSRFDPRQEDNKT